MKLRGTVASSITIWTLIQIGSLTARAEDDNENSTPTQWWMYSGQTATDVGNTVSSQNARIVDIKVDNFSPYPYTVTYVQNTGSFAKQWWYYLGIDGPTLSKALSTNNARLTAFKAYDTGGGQIRFTVAMISNTGADAKSWWYYPGLSTTDIGNLTKTNNARLTSMQSYVTNGQTRYAVVMIANTGADAKSWWWYPDTSAQDIGNALSSNKARLLDLTSSGDGNFNAVMESWSGSPAWWWYPGLAAGQVLSQAQQNGARVLTAETYPGCGGYCFATVMMGGSSGSQFGNVPAKLRGFVDLHTHPLSTLGFGGKLVYGGIDVGALLPADPNCNQTRLYNNPPTEVRATSMQQALGPDNSTHGGYGVFDNSCGDDIRSQVIHGVQQGNAAADEPDSSSGMPSFPNWPVWNDITHQRMWVDWIQRAYNGGLRVMVALAVNNKTLGDMTAGPGDFATDDLSSADLQIAETISFVNRHSDFMAIAYQSSDVTNIVNQNKLAVVLGVEIDNIGNLNTLGRAPEDSEISAAVAHLYDEGVRYIFPIHLLDNPFGGTAAYQDLFNYSTRRESGHWWNLVCANDPSIGYKFGAQNSFSGLLDNAAVIAKLGSGMDTVFNSTPSYPNCGQVNALGLTAQGTTALTEMMKRGMLIDIDHMSQNSVTGALAAAKSAGYPVNSGHNSVRGTGSNERSFTAAQYAGIGALHGMPGIGSAAVDAYSWIKNYLAVFQAMGSNPAAGFGTDTDGLAMGMPTSTEVDLPGTTTCAANCGHPPIQYTSAFPMSSVGGVSWNYNTVGVAHYGMLPDFLLAARNAPNGADLIDNNLMNGAQYFVDTWQLAENQGMALSGTGCIGNGICCGRMDHGSCAGTCVAENSSCAQATGYQCGSNQQCCGTPDSHGFCPGVCVATGTDCPSPPPVCPTGQAYNAACLKCMPIGQPCVTQPTCPPGTSLQNCGGRGPVCMSSSEHCP